MDPLRVKKSHMAQALLYLKGRRLSFEKYKPFQTIYDYIAPKITLKCGRQVGKSVFLGADLVLNSISHPYFNSLYFAPLAEQTKRFSNSYLKQFMDGSIIKERFIDSESAVNVFEKSFSNQSRIYLSYAETETDANRIRGIMSDQVMADETQDIQYEALPPILEVMASSEFAYQRYAGTSKNMNNTLEFMFRNSNQLEWVIRCQHCKKDIIPNEHEICMRMVSNPEGPICPNCARWIDVSKGRFIPMVPSVKDHYGYHIPQMIMGQHTAPAQWKKLYDKIHNSDYSRVKINNEIFGLADESAGKTFSINDARQCCNPDTNDWSKGWPRDSRGIVSCVMGIDWSVTGSELSYTIISILGYDYRGKAFNLYSERLKTPDILGQVERASQLAQDFEVQLIASDRGVGVVQCELLQNIFGVHQVIPVNYVSAGSKITWNRKGQFLSADRTQAMDNMAIRIKVGRDRFETPAWSVSADMWQDALNIHEEETLGHKRVYRKDPSLTDDWFHSIVFADLGYKLMTNQIETG